MRLIDADNLIRPEVEDDIGSYAYNILRMAVEDEPTVCTIDDVIEELEFEKSYQRSKFAKPDIIRGMQMSIDILRKYALPDDEWRVVK